MNTPTANRALPTSLWAVGLQLAATLLLALCVAWGLGLAGARLLPSANLLNGLPRDEHYFEHVVLESKVRMLDEASAKDVWVLGDSSCLFGFVPAEFERVTGRSSVNVGTFGFVGTSLHASFLEELMESGDRPEAVILWLHTHTLARSSEANEETGFPEWLRNRLRQENGGNREFRVQPNDAWGGSLRFHVLDYARWNEPQMGALVTPSQVNAQLETTAGWIPTEPMAVRKDFPCHDIHPDALNDLQRIGTLCAKIGVPLFVYLMPILSDGPCSVDALTRAEEQIVAAIGYGALVHDVPREVDWNVMQSPTHFASEAAMAATRDVARWVAARAAWE